MLDSRKPPQQIAEEEKARDEDTEKEVRRLVAETRMWRPANSAQWVAWGIVQAKVEGMDEKSKSDIDTANEAAVEQKSGESAEELEGQKQEAADAGEEGGEDEFDYLSYARERALFFWGDVVQLGLIGKDELPEEMMVKLKVVER